MNTGHPAVAKKLELQDQASTHSGGAGTARGLARRGYVLIAPALLATVWVLIPFFLAVYYSFTNYNLINPVKRFIGLKNYIDIISSPNFWKATSVTLRYAAWSVGTELVLGFIVAFLLNRETRVSKILRPLLILPLMVSPVVATLMWKLMMSPTMGLLNYLLSFVGARDFPWGGAPESAMLSVVLIDVWMFTPFVALLILAGLRALPQAPFEAALVDRASSWFIFRNLTLPLLKPYVLVAVLFRTIDSLRAFDIIFALTKGGPGDTLMNYQVRAYYEAFTYTNVAVGSAYMIINWVLVYLVSQFLVARWSKVRVKTA